MKQKHTCPYCGSTNTIAKGFRYNVPGPVPLRRCKSCGRRWTVREDASAGTETSNQATTEKTDSADEGDSLEAEVRPDEMASPDSDPPSATWG